MNCECGSPWKYKCPKCLVRTCSLPCYKKHQSICSSDSTDSTGPNYPTTGSSSSNTIENTTNTAEESKVDPTSSSSKILEDDEEPPVTKVQLESLKRSKVLKSALKDSKLRKILKEIQKNPKESLEKYKDHPIFLPFANQLLDFLET